MIRHFRKILCFTRCILSLCAYSLLSITLIGCGKSQSYPNISLSDPRLSEFSDLLTINRAILGLPALPPTAKVSVERSNGSSYDAMLHIYSKHEGRTIAFRKEAGKMKWIGEQVILDGPTTFATPDGKLNETLCWTYEISSVSGYPLNQLNITYNGPNPALSVRNLAAASVAPFEIAWRALP